MERRWRLASLVIAAVVTSTACAGAASPAGPGAALPDAKPGGVKRIVAAIQGDPHTLAQQLNPASRVRGIEALEELVSAGLTRQDNRTNMLPQLAESAPSLENGQWRLLPDGRMETTWRIRERAVWHDGTPFTAADIVFTAMVVRDKDLPIFNDFAYELIEGVEAPDARTVLVRWKQSYIEADTLFSYVRGLPMPSHLLETAYREEKGGLTDHTYWSTGFVGTGPFKLREWQPTSHLVLDANDAYVLGRPRLDQIEVRFILDANTLMANVLAGTVMLTLGRSINGEQAKEVGERWPEGRIEVSYQNWIVLVPQFINTSPAVVADVRFRRALMHAADRQQLVDVLMSGMSAVAHSWLRPNQPEYREIEERNVVRYEFDPARGAALLDGLGYSRGSDNFYRDGSGQRLSVEIRTTAGDDIRDKTMFTLVDFWQRVGVGVDPVVIPRQFAADLEYRATFPAFELVRNPNDVRGTRTLHSRYIALPENNFRVTGNRSRYVNAEMDALVDRYFTTIPKDERRQVMGQIVHRVSDQLVLMGMFYASAPTLVSNRLPNVTAGSEGAAQGWNAHEWELRS